MKRIVAAVMLVVVAAHLLLLYLNFSFRYSATIGVEEAARETRVSGNLALVFLALTVGLQFLIAWLLRPSKTPNLEANSSSVVQLSESLRPELYERYGVLWAASALSTVGLFGLLFFVAGRTSYLDALLKFLRLR